MSAPSEVVHLRFIRGVESAEAAAALGVSERSVKHDRQFARAWLRKEPRATAPPGEQAHDAGPRRLVRRKNLYIEPFGESSFGRVYLARHVLGSVQLITDRPHEAERAYRSLIDKPDDAPWAALPLAKALRDTGKAQRAIEPIDATLTAFPPNHRTATARAELTALREGLAAGEPRSPE